MTTRHRPAAATAVLITTMAITACGGSDSDTGGDRTATTTSATSTTQPGDDPFAGDDSWIAYSTARGSEQVWLVHPDGSDDHRIAADASGEQLLANWSPDGTRLVMTTRGSIPGLIYEHDLASDTSRPLIDCNDPCGGQDEPVYSPDGTKIAFVQYLGPFTETGPTDCGMWIGDVATGQATQITSNRPCDPRDYNPHWSPDGTQLTYWRWLEDATGTTGTAVFTIDSDGTNPQQLTEWDELAGNPDWSPDGKWIVYSTHPLQAFQEPEPSDLYRMRPDGTDVEQLTHLASAQLRATQPRYTPDGECIVYTSVTPSTRTLQAIPSTGGEPVVITDASTHAIYTHPTWQP